MERAKEFEQLISGLSADFVAISAGAIDAGIERWLERIVSFLDLERATLAQLADRDDHYVVTHSYAAPGYAGVPRDTTGNDLPWLIEQMRLQRTVVLSSVRELPPEASREREFMAQFGPRAVVTLPLLVGGRLIGVLSFGSMARERDWPKPVVRRLRLVADIFASALMRKREELENRQLLRFEKLLSTVSTTFIQLPASEIDGELTHALQLVVEFLNVDRGTIFTLSTDTTLLKRSHWYATPGTPLTPGVMSADFPWALGKLLDGEPVVLSRISDLPDVAVNEREYFETANVRSSVILPLNVGGRLCAAAAFIATREERVWPDALVPRLRMLGELFANALARKAMEEAQDHSLRFEQMISSLSARFAGISSDGVDHEINRALAEILTMFDVDQCALLEVSLELDQWHATHSAHIGDLEPVPATVDFPRFHSTEPEPFIVRGEGDAIAREDKYQYQVEPSAGEASKHATGFGSWLYVPIAMGSAIRHVLALGCRRNTRTWPKEHFPRLRLLGETLVNALVRARADAELRASGRLLAEAQRIARLGSWEWDIVTDTAASSEEAQRIFVTAPSSFSAFMEYLHPNDRTVVRAVIERAFEDHNEKLDLECRIIRKDCAERIIRIQGNVLYAADGAAVSALGTVQDVTELRGAEEETRKLRMQVWHSDRVARTGALTASLAHELNQPLAAILSNAQAGLRFIARDEPDMQEISEILKDIVRDDKRAAGVISGLRAMVQRQETERDRIDVAASVAEMLELLHSELVGANIEVGTDIRAGCHIRADKGQFQQVVLNLVMNAIEAMRECPVERRYVHFTARRCGKGMVQVAVRDSGTGVPPERLGTVFDAFWTTKSHGMGLGLAVCRSIIESHGGTIWVESNEDRGAAFVFELPAETVGGVDSQAAGTATSEIGTR